MPTREIRDPIHGFVYLDEVERRLVDSRPVQRLKYIHQLALTYLVYPGATHSRFEHALGTMELAGRAFDAIVRNSPNEARQTFGEDYDRHRWRSILRVAGLLHDIGHGPFSHAADQLFSDNVRSHEEMTRRLITADPIASLLSGTGTFRLDPAEVAFVATGLGEPTSQAALVAKEIITGDLGVDRMDYLWRDSQMCGVSYGKYDLPRTVDTLMLAAQPDGDELTLALEHGGQHAAEGLLTARYFMFSQVYYHDVRVSYDEHLLRFLEARLAGSCYPEDLDDYLEWDDIRVLSLLRQHADDLHARAILHREHFRDVRQLTPAELRISLSLVTDLQAALNKAVGERAFVVSTEKSTRSFAAGQILIVNGDLGTVRDILELSSTLEAFQPIWFVRVYSHPDTGTRTSVLNVIEEVLDEGAARQQSDEVNNVE